MGTPRLEPSTKPQLPERRPQRETGCCVASARRDRRRAVRHPGRKRQQRALLARRTVRRRPEFQHATVVSVGGRQLEEHCDLEITVIVVEVAVLRQPIRHVVTDQKDIAPARDIEPPNLPIQAGSDLLELARQPDDVLLSSGELASPSGSGSDPHFPWGIPSGAAERSLPAGLRGLGPCDDAGAFLRRKERTSPARATKRESDPRVLRGPGRGGHRVSPTARQKQYPTLRRTCRRYIRFAGGCA